LSHELGFLGQALLALLEGALGLDEYLPRCAIARVKRQCALRMDKGAEGLLLCQGGLGLLDMPLTKQCVDLLLVLWGAQIPIAPRQALGHEGSLPKRLSRFLITTLTHQLLAKLLVVLRVILR
jgi:hypothetical protein